MVNKKIIFGLLLLIFSFNVLALSSTDELDLETGLKLNSIKDELKNKISSNELKEVKITGYDKINEIEFYDITVDSGKNKVKLNKLKNIDKIDKFSFEDKNIKLKNKNYKTGTKVLTIEEPDIKEALVVLEKKDSFINKPLRLIYANDTINFDFVNESMYSQNSTHIWFETNHFSSWTTIPNYKYFPSIEETLLIVLSDFIVEDGEYPTEDVEAVYYLNQDTLTSQETITCPLDTNCVDTGSTIFYGGSGNMIRLEIETQTDNDVYLWGYDVGPTHYGSSHDIDIDAIIRGSDNNINSQDTFHIDYDSVFVTPKCGTVDNNCLESSDFSAITETSFTLTEEVLDRDLTHYVNFPALADKTDIQVRALYKLASQGWLDATASPYNTIVDNVAFSIPLSGLDSGEAYDVMLQIKYYDAETDQEEVDDSNSYQVQLISNDPTVQTVGAQITSTSAYFKALVDYKGYSGGDLGLHWYYKRVVDSTWIPIPTVGFIVPNDGSITTSQEVTGLNTDTTYHYYAEIVWNSGTETAVGNTIEFTPSASPSTTLDDSIVYYSFDDADLSGSNILDLSGNSNTGLNNGATTGATGIINEGFDFTGGTGDEVVSTNNVDVTNEELSICGWFNPETTGSTDSLIEVGNIDDNIFIRIDSGATIDIIEKIDNDFDFYRSSATVSAGSYFFVCGLFKSNTYAKLYINGVYDGEMVMDGILTNIATPKFRVGYENTLTSISFDGISDEVGVWDRIITDTEITNLFNGGVGFNPYTIITVEPTIQTLDATLITSTSATMNLISDFGSYDPVGGYFEYKENSSSTWIERPLSPVSITNNTIYSYTLQDLTPNTLYDFRGVVSYNGGTLKFGNTLQFTTDNIVPPIIEVRGTIAGDIDATLRGEVISMGDYSEFDIFWRYKKKTDVLYSADVGLQTVNTTGLYTHDISFLDSSTEYESCFFGLLNQTTYIQGFCLDFNTTAEGQPVIETQVATAITRTSAQLNGEILDIGTFDSVNCSFDYWNQGNSSNKLSTPILPYFTEVGIGDTVDNLFINTTYFYELLCTNTARGYSNSGGLLSFNTLSSDDVIEPVMTLVLNNTGSDFIELTGLIDNIDEFNVTYYFSLQDYEKVAISGSPLISSNESFIFDTYTFSNINLNDTMNGIFYVKMYGTYVFNETQQFIESSYIRVNLQEVIEGGDFELLPGWTLYIGDPLFFSFMFLILVPICGIGLCIAYGSTADADKNINRFLSWGLVATLLIVLVWFSVVGLIPTWQSTISITILAILGVYYIVKGRRGAY